MTTQVKRYNEKLIGLLEELASIMMKQGEPFRARAYQKAQETIMACPEDITNLSQVKGKPGIGETIMEKFTEFMETGTLKVLEREKNNPVNLLADIYGVGPKKAQELVKAGIHTVEQLRKFQDEFLNETQKVGLHFYEDILKRIPRTEVEEYEKVFQQSFQPIKRKTDDKEAKFEIVGSYRRGQATSGDIDLILTCKNKKTFVQFIDSLIENKVITHVLSRGPTKCLVIAKLPTCETYRRVDFLYSNLEEYPFAILYFTGSKVFNTVMRHQALNLNLTMNEHGLYKIDGKKKGEKVDMNFTTEKDIFDYLHMEYKTPQERTDGRAVILL